MTYLKLLKEKDCQQAFPYPAKLSFRNEGEIKTFPCKQRPTEFITGRLALQTILMGVFRLKDSNSHKKIKNRNKHMKRCSTLLAFREMYSKHEWHIISYSLG